MNTLTSRNRVVIVLIYVFAIIAGLFIILRYTQVTSDMTAFLPQGATQQQQIISTQYKRAAHSRAVMIAIQGDDQSRLISINKKISQQLKKSGLFSVVNNGQSTLPEKEAKLLFDHRFVLSDAAGNETYQADRLRLHLQSRLASMSSSFSPLLKKLLPRDPAGEFENVLGKLKSDIDVRKVGGIFFSGDNRRSLILAIPAAQATDLNQQQQAIDEINKAYSASDHEGTELVLAGPVIIALSAKEQIRNDVRTLSLSATIIVIAFLYLAFGSARIVLLSAIPLASGMLAGAVATTLIYETVHGITIAFGATLIGIAVDYPMHFFSHLGGRKTPFQSMGHIWPTLRLSVLTTTIGFSSLLFSGYSGLSQLAVFSIFGVLAAVLTTRFLLPEILAETFTHTPVVSRINALFRNYANKAERLWPALIIMLVISVAVLVIKSNWLGDGQNRIWNDNLYALSPASEQQLELDQALRRDLNLRHSNEMILVTGQSQEKVLQSAELLNRKLSVLADRAVFGGYEVISSYLPSINTQKNRLAKIPSEKKLRYNLKQASTGLPFRENLFEPFIQDVTQSRKQQPVTLESFSGTVLADKFAPLIFKSDKIWATTVLLYDLQKPEVIRNLLNESSGNQNWTYINLAKETKNTMVGYRQEALKVFSIGALAILFSLWLGTGSARNALSIVAIPFSVVLVDSAILSMFGIELTLFHLVAMLLVAGLGIDYALFFNRIRKDIEEWDTSFPALWKSWLTTVLVFGSLMLSDTAVLTALGQTVTLGVTLCFIFGLIWTRRFSSAAGSL